MIVIIASVVGSLAIVGLIINKCKCNDSSSVPSLILIEEDC